MYAVLKLYMLTKTFCLAFKRIDYVIDGWTIACNASNMRNLVVNSLSLAVEDLDLERDCDCHRGRLRGRRRKKKLRCDCFRPGKGINRAVAAYPDYWL